MKLKAIAALALLGVAGSAQAVTHTIVSTFDPTTVTRYFFNTVMLPNTLLIGVGDTVDLTINFTGGQSVTIDNANALWTGLFVGRAPYETVTTSGTMTMQGAFGPAIVSQSVTQGNQYVHIGSYYSPVATASGPIGFNSLRQVFTVDSDQFGTQRDYVQSFFYFQGDLTPGGGGGAVPEPASWAMMVAGFGLVGAALRRRVTRVTVNA